MELWTIQRAVELCQSNPSLRGRVISVVSDSNVVVSWVNSQGIGILDHVQTIYDIRNHLISLGNASVVYCSRASNSFADIYVV